MATVLTVAVAMSARPAMAQSRLEWDPEWRRVGTPEYVATGAFFGGFAAIRFGVSPADVALWTSPLPLDREIRSGLVATTRSGRRTTGLISDSIAIASVAQPMLIDGLLVAAVVRRSSNVAWQMEVINTEAYAFSLFLNMAAKRFFARQRPYGIMCKADPEYTDCEDLDRYRSFYSGHASLTATSAGLTCAHHTHLPLYGGGVADPLACGVAVVGTLATGALRITSDKHWASDVLVGHVMGFVAGYVLPSLIYYGGFRARPSDQTGSPDGEPMMPTQLRFGGEF